MDEEFKKIESLEAKIKDLEEEMTYLKDDLEAADEEVEDLQKQIKNLETAEGIFLNKDKVIERIKELLGKALHNVNLTGPSISDISKLDLFEINSSVNIKVATFIDQSIPEHIKLKDELGSFDNIDIRLYGERDRWSAIIDGDTLFFAVVGAEPNNFLSFTTRDPKHIHVFNSLAMETWLRGKKIKK
ncbi:MAG: coiled-coil domain-containing protein [Promethearchaeota archaeon]